MDKKFTVNKIEDTKFLIKWDNNEKIICSPDKTSAHGIWEITSDDQMYDLKDVDNISIKNFMDVGSNIGLSTIWAKINFPDVEITALEPGVEVFDHYIKNTDIWANSIDCINVAAGVKEETLTFWYSSIHNGGSTTDASMVSEKHDKSYEVKSIDVYELIHQKYHDDVPPENRMIKIDIEGAEDPIINDSRFLDLSKKFGWIMIELHGDVKKQISQYEKIKEIFPEDRIAVEIQSDDYPNYRKKFGTKCQLEAYLIGKNI